MGVAIISIVAVALIGAFIGQSFLNTNARNLTAAMNDATRVMEQIRQQNSSDREPCKTQKIPTAVPVNATGTALAQSWNNWLTTQNPGKTINKPGMFEHVAVTCQDGSSTAPIPPYCGPNQVGNVEWSVGSAVTSFDPIRVTVAVGWYQYPRTLGNPGTGQEFVYQPGQTTTSGKFTTTTSGSLCVGTLCGVPTTDVNRNGVIESQAMLTTLITCR